MAEIVDPSTVVRYVPKDQAPAPEGAPKPPQRYLPVMAGSRPAGMRPVSEEEYQASMDETKSGLQTVAMLGAGASAPTIAGKVIGALPAAAQPALNLAGRIAANPLVNSAAGAYTGYKLGGIPGAGLGLLYGAAGGKLPGRAGTLMRMATGGPAEGETLEAYALRQRVASTLSPKAVENAETILNSGRTTSSGTIPAPVNAPTMGPISARMPVGAPAAGSPAITPPVPKTGLEGLPLTPDGKIMIGGVKVDPNNPGNYASALEAVKRAASPTVAAELQEAAKPALAAGLPPRVAAKSALADSITNKVMGMKEQGLSSGQIASVLEETHGTTYGMTKDDARTIVDMIDRAKLPQAKIMNRTLAPEGQRSLPTVGGGQAQMRFTGAHQGPFPRIYDPNVPTNPVDPSEMLQRSIQAYRGGGQ